jgi:hypothetical protein
MEILIRVRIDEKKINWPKMSQSKAHVKFSRNMLFPNFFGVKYGPKNPKKSVKIRLFRGRFKKSRF